SATLSLLGWRNGPYGSRLGILELGAESSLFRRYGAFAGIEGAPVFDATGAFVGAVTSSIGDLDCRLCGFTEASALERLWIAGRRNWSQWPVDLFPSNPKIPVRAGDPVALSHWWCDSPDVAHEFGTITESQGDEAILVTTSTLNAPPSTRGRDLQVLL